ncbi:unnamed protein product [Oppiella nova]|uniref:Uncharacterized protein n=1 Tax=Oppiella nova TaxID=334625 RepID=A0A7R9LUS7_9ACAR|nr:unnamed protein product [Oppiella nova]CAG2167163.1 unnamed protein product [Oppiella nova]
MPGTTYRLTRDYTNKTIPSVEDMVNEFNDIFAHNIQAIYRATHTRPNPGTELSSVVIKTLWGTNNLGLKLPTQFTAF